MRSFQSMMKFLKQVPIPEELHDRVFRAIHDQLVEQVSVMSLRWATIGATALVIIGSIYIVMPSPVNAVTALLDTAMVSETESIIYAKKSISEEDVLSLLTNI